MTDNTTTAETIVQHVDPRTLVPSERNTRTDLGDLSELAASIAASGVLEPLVVARDTEGETIILAGHRRTAAAIKAGAETVPVIYRDDLTGDIDQLTVVLSENLHRRGLNDAEVVRAVQQMIDLGESGASIARRTGLAKSRTTRLARVARSSDAVRDAVSEHEATLDQALTLDEFKDDPDALASLLDVLDRPGEFDALARRYRADVKVAKDMAASLAQYAADGVTAYAEDDEDRPDGTGLLDVYGWEVEDREAAHADCPHRALVLSVNIWQQSIRIGEVCTQPETHPEYVEREQARADARQQWEAREEVEADPEAKKAERRRVIANNKAMDGATAHRLAWLAGILKPKRPDLGKNPATMIARLYASRGHRIGQMGFHADTAIQEIGWKHGEPTDRAHAATALAFLFALVAAAIEQDTTRQAWRDRHSATQHAEWLTYLTPLGYEPTAIEQAMIDGTSDNYTDQG